MKFNEYLVIVIGLTGQMKIVRVRDHFKVWNIK